MLLPVRVFGRVQRATNVPTLASSHGCFMNESMPSPFFATTTKKSKARCREGFPNLREFEDERAVYSKVCTDQRDDAGWLQA